MEDIASTIIPLGLVIFLCAGMWKVFAKAGEPGWAALIPIFNFVILLKIAGKPIWWILLMFIPLVNFIIAIVIAISVAERFGRSAGFGIGLALLGFVFYPILGFGDSKFIGDGQVAHDPEVFA